MWLSTEKKDDTTLKLTAVHRYASERAAEDSEREIIQLIEEALGAQLRDVQLERDHEFVKLTAELTVEDLLQSGDKDTALKLH